jgi:acetyl esterase/lipase
MSTISRCGQCRSGEVVCAERSHYSAVMMLRAAHSRTVRVGILALAGMGVLSGCKNASDDGGGPDPDPVPVFPRTFTNVAYVSGGIAQRFDLYLPDTGRGPFPLVVWIHGGGWSGGSRDLTATSPQRQIVSKGFALASVDYRLSGAARYPASVNDVKAAIRFFRANAATYKIDPDRIAAWGSSAGGHLAAMLGVTGDVARFDDATLGNPTQSSRVQAVVNWFGPADLLQMDADGAAQGCPLWNGFGHDNINAPEGAFLGAKPSSVPDHTREASPQTWVSVDDPPMLLQHGGRDCTVPIGQSRRLRDALRGVMDTARVPWTELPNDGHGGAGFETAANVALVTTFLTRWLR